MQRMWVPIAVCELVAMNVGSLAVSVGSQPLIFARIVGSQSPLFASPLLIVCGPLQLAKVGKCLWLRRLLGSGHSVW
jgi:hypothetical protein